MAESPLRALSAALVEGFREIIADAGLSSFLRTRRGDEVDAACGPFALRDGSELVALRKG